MAAEMKKSMVIELLTFYRNIDGEILWLLTTSTFPS